MQVSGVAGSMVGVDHSEALLLVAGYLEVDMPGFHFVVEDKLVVYHLNE